MKVKRRIYNPETEEKKEVVEEVKLIRQNSLSIMVQLSNGDVIKRKLKDIVEENKK
ncbi:MAG: hypothetical protein PVG65_00510 [Candidatus Thorarchaeota archaeon]|jgi:hypothetical protein